MTARGALASAVLLGMVALSCGGQPYSEAKRELERILEPAVDAAFAGVTPMPQVQDEAQQCSDPFVGPRDGLRPALTYRTPLDSLTNEGAEFIAAAEAAWEKAGFTVSTDDEEGILSRRVSSGSYRAEAMVNMANQEALIGGSGPCARQ